MKRALSLILAVVMVALMIPFAAIIASATEEETPSEIVLPEGWVMSTDDGEGVANSQDEQGVVLGSDTQSIALTEKVGNGKNRVVAIDFGIVTKVKWMRVSWETEAPTAGNVPQADNEGPENGEAGLIFGIAAGPDEKGQITSEGITYDANFKVAKDASSGAWMNPNAGDTIGYVRTTVDGEFTKNESQARYCIQNNHPLPDESGRWQEIYNVFFDGACGTNGTKMTMYVELDANDNIAGAYMQYVLYDADGNFVKEYVYYAKNSNSYKAVCDGYLTIGHSGWGGNCALKVKSVSITEGAVTVSKDGVAVKNGDVAGEVLHSANFATKGEETLYAVDFSKINCDEELEMAGWNSINQSGVNFDAISYVDGGIKYAFNGSNNFMLEAVQFEADRNYVVEYSFKWNTDAWVAINHFEHKDTTTYVSAAAEPNTNGIKFRSNATTGKGYAFDTHKYYSDAALTQAIGGPSAADKKAMDEGATVTFRIIIEKGYSNVVEMTVGETTYYLKANSARPVADGGMFGFAHVGGANAARYIILENFAVYDTTYYENTPDVFKAQVVLNGISVFVRGGETVDMSDLPGAVAVKVDEAYVAPAEMTLAAGETYEVLSNFDLAADTDIAKGEASLRVIEEENGIRFTSKFDAADLQLLVDLYDKDLIKKVEAGTLITTKAWAEAAGAVTFDALDAVKGDKTAYVEVMATVGDWYAENTFAGTISNVSAEREYQAAGFIRITLANDEVVFVYSAVNAATLASVTPAEA